MKTIEKAIIEFVKTENIQGKDQLNIKLKEILKNLDINY